MYLARREKGALVHVYPIRVDVDAVKSAGIFEPFVGDGAETPRHPSPLCDSGVWAIDTTKNGAVMLLRQLEDQI